MTVGTSGPVVLIGDPAAVFVRRPARVWRDAGHEVVIVTARIWEGPERLDDGTRVVCVHGHGDRGLAREMSILEPILRTLENELGELPDAGRERAHDRWGRDKPMPSIVPAVGDGVAISQVVRALAPRLVFGQEAFAYGLATALSVGAPRGLMVWGGDVEMFADASPVARALVRYSLRSVDRVLVGATALAERAVAVFGVRPERCHLMSLGVDREMFTPPTPEAQIAMRATLGLGPSCPVVMNLRRHDPLWGSEMVMAAFARVAEARPDVHFLLLGGTGNEARLDAALAEAARSGFADRVVVVRGQVEQVHYARLLQAADIGVSLALWEEPLSWSVVQALATGLGVATSARRSYHEALAQGAPLSCVEGEDPQAVAGAVLSLMAPGRRAHDVRAAAEYLDRHQSESAAFVRLWATIDGDVAAGFPQAISARATCAGTRSA